MKVLAPTVSAAFFGSLRPHPWVVPHELDEDAYSLFFHRSELMGWSESVPRARPGRLWDMNDAAFEFSTTDQIRRVAWFQVGVDEHRLSGATFPFHALLACAADSLGRVGRLDVHAVQLLVPLQVAGAPAFVPTEPNWFTACDPAARTGVRITLDSGDDPVMPRVAAEVGKLVSTLAGEPFRVGPDPSGTAHVQLRPEVTRLGGRRHPVSFDATAPDWTTDSAAWLANLFAESCRRTGVATPVLINISRR